MTINVYLSQKTLDQLNDTRKKYHVSISTIAQILSDYVSPMINDYPSEYLLKYIDTEHRNKTSIKPRNCTENEHFFQKINQSKETASHIYSNLLYLYANNQLNKILMTENKQILSKSEKEIEKELISKREIFWNYNTRMRETVRIVRKNQDYFAKILN